ALVCSCGVVGAASTVGAPASQMHGAAQDAPVKVRFAPSPTGNLHVGGARTALFNWLYAKNRGGKMVLRVEDTDKARSTKESEEAMYRELRWLGLMWDEGPDVGGPNGPYRQSERTDIYMKYVNQLVAEDAAYPCFCTDEDLNKMKRKAEELKLPPIYRGPWASADKEKVQEWMDRGEPYCYRFRVPKEEVVTIHDAVRGQVSWNTNTLGDFVIMRSNGLPVYNFCVAIDDALMGITDVVRAEEHLPNTLRQVLIYRALGFPEPQFAHVSLILAPDKSKLSKRHGATSVGEFRDQGFLPMAMVNYLSLLGWNDGTEQEIYTLEELQDKFSIDRITKSGAVFDKTKLAWMNGQHLRTMPTDEVRPLLIDVWQTSGLLKGSDGTFIDRAVELVKDSLELVKDGDAKLRALLSYPLEETVNSSKAQKILEDGFKEVAMAVVAAYDDGSLQGALEDNAAGFSPWVKKTGKELDRKGKRLFMPLRIALTGSMQGPDIGKLLAMLGSESGEVAERSTIVSLGERMGALRSWLSA
ncbi:unnamed protein product, partial [Ostreobium quekettii]